MKKQRKKKTKKDIISWCASLDDVLRPDYAITGEDRVCAINDLIDKLCSDSDLDCEPPYHGYYKKLWRKAQKIGWDIEKVKISKE